jgi:hypothetical protein
MEGRSLKPAMHPTSLFQALRHVLDHCDQSWCARPATVDDDHESAALPPGRTPIPAANNSDIGATTEGKMLGKVFAVTFVIGLLVTGSAAFIANHPHSLAACAADCE